MTTSLSELNERSREIFRQLVETYLETGEPVGSRTLSKILPNRLSAASVRNVMQDLEELGLLDSPHVSAGRQPTLSGLRLFVDGMLEVGGLSPDEESKIRQGLGTKADEVEHLLAETGSLLSGLSSAASLVIAPKTDAPIKHIDFVSLSSDQALVVLVKENGEIENRLIDAPPGLTPSAMQEAANFLNAQLRGRSLTQVSASIEQQIDLRRRELNEISQKLVAAGVASWGDVRGTLSVAPERLIVRGRGNLLKDLELTKDVERMSQLFDDLETKEDLAQLLDLTVAGDGVRVFIGAENKLFSLTGSSLIISPYMNADQQVVGAIGVIGPTRINYGRVVPIVDFTARLVGRLLDERKATGG
ncbi:MAG: heat-inducible transcriptional repressor HrcA [Neomegalonema sp.]|nr:heat-inducible transcriptional repressor HrcA [Neomegalonema sp.]